MKQQRDDDDAPTVRDYLFAVGSPLAFLHFIKIPGYFILQYLCWWNRWRIVEYDSWRVLVIGVLFWVTSVGAFILVVRSGTIG